MLKNLSIHNIILVESAEIQFEASLNVLSGETGSGKSAIMHALALIIGSRADVSLIRNGAEKGSVEAVFDIQKLKTLQHFLDEAGIEHHFEDDLIIRRELTINGKSRAFVNHQSVQQTLLRRIGEHLIEMVGQHATQNLFTTDHHRHIVDLFGEVKPDVMAFQESWLQEIDLRKKIEQLISTETNRVREIEICQRELEELHEANLKLNEDEELFAEYSLLANSEERLSKSQAVYQALVSKREALLPQLSSLTSTLESLSKIDPSLEDLCQNCRDCRIELQEIAYTLQSYINKIDASPERLHILNERLALINRLKRKYGSTIAEIHSYMEETNQKLHTLENTSVHIQALQEELEKLIHTNHTLAQNLSKKRQTASKNLERALQKELRSLNMPKVEFFVRITPQQRTRTGDDHIEFFLSPNVGEKEIAIRDCASGGELSRLMLALQTLLAGTDNIPTLIFDEIDANIGGETATIIGEKLKTIGKKHQVLCITHFPQVAQQAAIHWQITKKEQHGRTYTFIEQLDEKGREEELFRMSGKSYLKIP